MSFEIDVVFSDFYDPAYACDASEKSATLLETDHIDAHCRAIFNQKHTQMYLNSKSVQILSQSSSGEKKAIKICSLKGSEIKAGLTVEWGNRGKPNITLWGEGKCYDNHGNSAEVTISHNGDGTGKLEMEITKKTNN